MLDKYKYTNKEQKKLLSTMGILIDTREKSSHIFDWLCKKNINYKVQKLDQGDYSFYLPANKELDIDRDLYFDKEYAIERKGSLEELSTNMTKDRQRLKNEFAQHKGKMILLIENANYEDICKGNYKSQYNNRSYLASLHSMSSEFNIPFIFSPNQEYTPIFVYFHFYYYLRNIIK